MVKKKKKRKKNKISPKERARRQEQRETDQGVEYKFVGDRMIKAIPDTVRGVRGYRIIPED